MRVLPLAKIRKGIDYRCKLYGLPIVVACNARQRVSQFDEVFFAHCVCLRVCLLVFVCYNASSKTQQAKIRRTARISPRVSRRFIVRQLSGRYLTHQQSGLREVIAR
jgi:hypothetical protein